MNLRNKILLLVFIATIAPLIAMSWVLIENHDVIEKHLMDRLTVNLETVSKDLEDKVSSTAQLLFGLGQVPMLDIGSKKECSIFLADVLKENPQYTGILTIKPNGDLYCDSLQSDRVLNLTDRSYFQRAIETRKLVVEPAVGRLTGKNVLQIAYPVADSRNRLKFILLASLNLDEYGKMTASKLSFDKMHFQLWNSKGSFILDYPKNTTKMVLSQELKEVVLLPNNKTTDLIEFEQESLFIFKTILPKWTNLNLILTLIIPENVIGNYINGQFKQTLTGVIVFILLVLVVTLTLVEVTIRRQLERLIYSMSKLTIGDYSSVIGEPYPSGELGDLMKILDEMSISIKQQTEKLYQQANYDSLTNLANRNLLNKSLEESITNTTQNNSSIGVLLLDLDRFKIINDSLGHVHGDALLKIIAERLTSCLHRSDIVGRFGGDEFVIILNNIKNASNIKKITNKILTIINEPINIDSHMISITASIGIAIYPDDTKVINELFQYADTAMYRSKNKGGNVSFFFTKSMNDNIQNYLATELGLQQAINKNELMLYYQPVIDSQTGKIISGEALIRWKNVDGRIIGPAEFISIAEETGLIIPIGFWILNEACKTVKQWQNLKLGNITIGINLSARQFKSPILEESIRRVLIKNNCPASLLQLEITESSIMTDMDQSIVTINNLKALGIKISIDDFGTGYSSLSQLKQLPIDHIKIDQSFVSDIVGDGDFFIETITTLARKLNLQTIAEGVETQQQVDFLRSKNCDSFQGFLFSRPVNAIEFEALLYKFNGE